MIYIRATPDQLKALSAYREDLEAHGVVMRQKGDLVTLDVLNVPVAERETVARIMLKIGESLSLSAALRPGRPII